MAFDGNLEEVGTQRRIIWGNGYRPTAVYSPGALDHNRKPVKGAGKRPVGNDWRGRALRNPPADLARKVTPGETNTGIVCGEVVALDVDVLAQEITDEIVAKIEAVLGPTPLSRIGRAPKIVLCYRAEEHFAKLATEKYRLPDGSEAQLEILADGQQFVAFGLHPDTMQPFEWPDRSPCEVRLADLPTISAMQARDLIGEAVAILKAAGGVEKKSEATKTDESKPPATKPVESSFFRVVNAAALDDIAAWAAPLGFHDRGNSGWRLSSEELGRPLEEAVSIHPDGIWDFGEEKPLTAIDVVIKLAGVSDAVEAAHWLCERLGKDPVSLGWQSRTRDGPFPEAAPPEGNGLFRLLTLNHWLDRDVPSPDFLLGEVLSTTSRAMLVGPTGLGKTMIGLALAMAIAEGRDFLHWRVPRPRRVLYLDGEMSRRLLKKRIVDEVRRSGADRATTLFVLSREDFPDLAPLNSEAGQHFIDSVIEAIGGVDLIVVDNIQAWTVGDQREETTWEPVLPWVRDLTRRNIGQLWIHHTGHDETHAYGPKAREWQLDLVMLMEATIDADDTSDLGFTLKFPKARERTPDNRQDFADTVIALDGDAWTSKSGGDNAPKRQSKRATLEDYALECLVGAMLAGATEVHNHPKVPPTTMAVTVDLWKRYFLQNYVGKAEPGSQEKMFYSFAGKLQAQHKIRVEKPWVWKLKSASH